MCAVLKNDLRAGFDARAAPDFSLHGTVIVRMHGVGGRTVQKVTALALSAVSQFAPGIVLLELRTNDLASVAPAVVMQYPTHENHYNFRSNVGIAKIASMQ